MTAPQSVTCPYCSAPVASLLSGCERDECRSREITADKTFDLAVDA